MNAKSKRVIFYALGEILLVVVGILIAVQINNWNTNRKLALAEERTLIKLHEDLQKDLRRYEFLDSALNHHIDLCDSAISLFSDASLEARKTIIRLRVVGLFHLENYTTTFEEMVNTGKLYSLSNKELRSEIIEYYRDVSKWDKYSEKENDETRSTLNHPNLNDYRIIRWNMIRNKEVNLDKFQWFDNRNSNEWRSIYAMIYTSRSNMLMSEGPFSYLKRKADGLRSSIESEIKD